MRTAAPYSVSFFLFIFAFRPAEMQDGRLKKIKKMCASLREC
jgi:hypothetical protein